MGIVFAIICVLGSAATIMIVSSLGLAGWLKAVIVVPVVLLAVYSMARIPPQEAEEDRTAAAVKSPLSSQGRQSGERQAA